MRDTHPIPGARSTGALAAARALGVALLVACLGRPGHATGAVLWSFSDPVLVRPDQNETVLLTGGLSRDDTASDTLYLRFRVAPMEDAPLPDDEIGLELRYGSSLRLGVGKARGAVGYSAYPGPTTRAERATPSFLDLRSAQPEPDALPAGSRFEVPRRGRHRTLVLKIQFIPGAEDLVTVWLDPDLGPGANEVHQPETLRTDFYVDASFDRIVLRCDGTGPGWWFCGLALATTFADFVEPSSVPLETQVRPRLHVPAFETRTWRFSDPARPICARAMAFTSEGYLWIAGSGGLLRFDGQRFEPIPLPSGTGPDLRHLATDGSGALWVVTPHGKTLQLHLDGWADRSPPGPPSGPLTRPVTDARGHLWLARGHELWRWEGQEWKPCTRPPDAPSPASAQLLAADPAQGVWILREDQLLEQWTDNGELRARFAAPVTPPDETAVSLLVQPDGVLWLATTHRIWKTSLGYAQPAWEPVWSANSQERVLALVRTPCGLPAAVLNTGEWLAGDPNSSEFARFRILPPWDQISYLLADTDGSLWVLQPDRLWQLRPQWRRTILPHTGSTHAPVTGLVEVAPGTLWMAQPGEGILRWAEGRLARLTVAGMPSRDAGISLLARTSDGSCWLATSAGLLRFKDPRAVADECQNVGLPGRTVRALAETGPDTIWIGTAEGELWRLHRGQWQRSPGPWDGAPLTALCPAGDELWIGTAGRGLFRLDPRPVPPATRAVPLPARHVFALRAGDGPVLWAATDTGLWHGFSNRWTRVHPASDQPPAPVWAVVEDDQDRLWWVEPNGLACAEVIRDPDRADTLPRVRVLRTWPGVGASPSGPSDSHPAVLLQRDSEGQIWLAHGRTLEVFDPAYAPVHVRPLRVVIQAVRVNDRLVAPGPAPEAPSHPVPAAPGQPLDLGAGARSVEIEFAVLNAETDDVRVTCKLDGLDEEWHTVGPARRVTYGHLRPGRYRFLIRASEGSHPGRTAEHVLPLRVRPHLWQRPWFTGTLLLATVLAGGALAQTRERRRARRRLVQLEREHALERERARIARDLHDEMGGKLCRISFLTEHLRRHPPTDDPDRSTLVAIGETARELLGALDEIVWAVNPANDTLEHLAAYLSQHAQDFFQGTPIECRVELPETLPAIPLPGHIRHHLFRAVHEALANALRHSGATCVELRLTCTDRTMIWTVCDNGHGFDPAAPGGGPGGCGLHNLHTRMAELGGACTILSRPGEGTVVRLELPLQPVESQPESRTWNR